MEFLKFSKQNSKKMNATKVCALCNEEWEELHYENGESKYCLSQKGEHKWVHKSDPMVKKYICLGCGDIYYNDVKPNPLETCLCYKRSYLRMDKHIFKEKTLFWGIVAKTFQLFSIHPFLEQISRPQIKLLEKSIYEEELTSISEGQRYYFDSLEFELSEKLKKANERFSIKKNRNTLQKRHDAVLKKMLSLGISPVGTVD